MEPLRFLTDDEVEAIHHATLRVLAETGIVLTLPAARDLLAGAGACVDGDRVRLPADLVEACLAKAPRTVTLRGRGGGIATLGDGSLHWHNMGGARDIFDPAIDGTRPATLADVRDSTVVLDAMEHVTTVTPLYTPRDVPGSVMSLAMYRAALPNTTKPLQGPGVQNAAEVRLAIRMAEVIGPPQEVLSLSVSPVSPLIFPDGAVEAIMKIAQQGVAFGPLPCPTAGATAPMSIAGALAQQNAELLASMVIAELVRPGLPIIYCGRLAMMEPHTGSSVWGGVELGIASAGTVQVGHRYGLPVNVYGFSSNAFGADLQSGFERAMNALIPALAGADELSGIGEIGAGVASSHAQIVADNEIAASVKRALRGFAVDANSLAVEVIGKVMDGPRNFLGERHSLKYLRGGEVLLAKLALRSGWDEWDRGGRDTMIARAQAEAERLLREHEVPLLSEDQTRALDAIMDEAVHVLGGPA